MATNGKDTNVCKPAFFGIQVSDVESLEVEGLMSYVKAVLNT